MTAEQPRWSGQQQAALAQVDAWLRAPAGPQVFRLQGYAGTGKTTISHDVYGRWRARACAFTGKAASVMAAKGLANATTLHRLIYQPMGDDEQHVQELRDELALLEKLASPGRAELQRMDAVRRALADAATAARKPKFILKEESAIQDADLVILDEASMIDERMGEDLLSFGVRVLVLGDPAQLPPVKGAGFFMTDDEVGKWSAAHTVTLTEIHRQARDNPIIRLSMDVREGRGLQYGEWAGPDGDVARVVRGVNKGQALAADQVLCGTNAMRRGINNRHRELAGHEDVMPQPGEKLVCLKNNHDLALLNGTQWECLQSQWDGGEAVDLRVTGWGAGAGLELGLPACAMTFQDEEVPYDPWSGLDRFTYGYGMTVHKAQGSQWNDVILFDDWPSSRDHRRWLYTGVTRAARNLTVVRS